MARSRNKVDEIAERAATPPRPVKRHRTWPYVILLLLAWGTIFGGDRKSVV